MADNMLKYNQNGFSLLELSAVLVVVGFLLGMIAKGYYGFMVTAEENAQQDKMRTVELAIQKYWMARGVLPCPADNNLTLKDSDYGTSTKDCYNSCSGGVTCSNKLATGMIPYKTLDLTLDVVTDLEKNRLIYAVDSRMTLKKCEFPGSLVIKDGDDHVVSDKVAYVVMAKNEDKCKEGLDQLNCSNGNTFVMTNKNVENAKLYYDDKIIFASNIKSRECFSKRSDCGLWLDASDNCGMIDSNSSVTFLDKAGASYDFTPPNTASSPSIASSAPQNGFQYLHFSGSNYIQNSTFVPNSSGWTMFFAVRASSYSGTLYAVSKSIGATPNYVLYFDASTSNILSLKENGVVYPSTTALLNNAPHIISSKYDPAVGYSVYLDGIQVISETNNAAIGSGYTNYIGGHNTFGKFTGDIFEVAEFKSALSDLDRVGIEAEIAERWGIAY